MIEISISINYVFLNNGKYLASDISADLLSELTV